ncbi:hypothetical protein CBOM_04295 [Ceraceosorus bombacis]|uniref:Uncharacterized protein n=1 Tax=Ceraceosorus bombacis TaxID=401625 RepID=A0A0P1BNX4_9BASI|nr:hypothetical protein CBOM_04295 [Ceraceosorus bombacis]
MTLALPPNLAVLADRVASGSACKPPLQYGKNVYNQSLTGEIEQWVKECQSPPSARALLYSLNDDPEAHEIAQADEGDATSDLLHSIHHRREGDFWNSKWWIRQISHPVLQSVHGGSKGAQSFVDAVESITKGAGTVCGAKRLDELRDTQAKEFRQLLRATFDLQGDRWGD